MIPCSKGTLTPSTDPLHGVQQSPQTAGEAVLISLLSLFAGPDDPGSLSAAQRVAEQWV